jgi:hypothetical protein
LSAPTTGADRTTPRPGSDLDEQHIFSVDSRPLDGFVNKGLELLHPIQNSLQLHPGFFSRFGFVSSQYQIQDWDQDALPESFPLPSGAFYKLIPFTSFLNLEIKTKPVEPVEMWESQASFRRGFSKQMRHFHQAGNSA